MKCSVFLTFTLLLIVIPEYESLKILKKIKDFLHPTTTTAATPVVPDYETKQDRQWPTTATWEGPREDFWETTTSGTNTDNSNYGETPQHEKSYISYSSTTTSPTNFFVGGNKDSSSASVSSTNDGGAPPETPGIVTIPTLDNIYNNNFQPNYPSVNNDRNKYRAPTSEPTITNIYDNQLQLNSSQAGHNPVNNQGNTSSQQQPDRNSQDRQKQPETEGGQRKPTSPDYNPQDLNGSDTNDIVFPPDELSVSSTKHPGEPVGGQDGRTVIKAPPKDCGTGKKLDNKGDCRKIAS